VKSKKYTNALIDELSAYLLQHAHNPVQWFPWDQKYLDRAKEEGKLLLISIGYASCHWCHVMEHECFEDEEVAALMNSNFINMKVDREERPDVDQVYMNALQIITGQGGWPLNIIALPDGRPIWGGTYFPKKRWMEVLSQIYSLSKENPEKVIQYADELEKGLAHFEFNETDENEFKWGEIRMSLDKILSKRDLKNGGLLGAPKFMMPTLLRFIQYGGLLCNNQEALNHFHLSLEKMALGGIFDAIGGGFSRYAVDSEWHIPHFEKMGYDNGQLLSLYAQAYREKPLQLYRETVEKTIRFLSDNLLSPEGGFYAALDADSIDENGVLVEGAFYVWQQHEIKELFPNEHELVSDYYSINESGYWEDGNHVLRRLDTDEKFGEKHKIYLSELKTKVLKWDAILLMKRKERILPRLDDKVICSWNAILTSGLLESYVSFKNESYLDLAAKSIRFIEQNFISNSGTLKRISKKGVNKIDAFLEDYSDVIKMYIDAYEILFDEHYLNQADKLAAVCLTEFEDQNSPLLFFSSTSDLVLRTKETSDNVIPSSNAIMAENLIRLSNHLIKPEYISRSRAMLTSCKSEIQSYPGNYSYWLTVALRLLNPGYEVVAVGPNSKNNLREIRNTQFSLNCSWAAAEESDLPLFQNRISKKKTLYYLCKNNHCELPLESIEEVKEKLRLLN
jgi:uncharacterized protein